MVKKARSKKTKTSGSNNRKFSFRSAIFYCLSRGLIILLVFGLAYTAYLDLTIRKQFEGQKWALPAHVYTRPMELYLGQVIDRKVIEDELRELGYRTGVSLERVGSYRFTQNKLTIHQREFQFWDDLQPQQLLSIQLNGNQIQAMSVAPKDQKSQQIEIVRLEPRLFGSVSPLSHEDRSLLKIEDTPPQLINALIAIEDRKFYSHFGVNPLGIARAMLRNISAGKVVQGGSTLTQQLIKNYYLTSDRTIKRKLNEMIMAVLLEIHYSKDEILEAYLNEVYLSQAGNRAIHGFALGSQYFFARPLNELNVAELATLAGLVKGPSSYNPLKYPEKAKKRRNIVLNTMLQEGYIEQAEYDQAVKERLVVSANTNKVAPLSYPAFMGFLQKNLEQEYQQQDIHNDGLQIYTTLNPRLQSVLEKTVNQQLTDIEKRYKIKSGTLQVAAVLIRTDNGEVSAMVGDRKAKFSGYNRAVQAQRPIGSLIKPFVYLTALEQPERFSLATRLNDSAITVRQKGSKNWSPQNYDGAEHGQVMLIDALARSYNLATVQLGMEIGVDEVAQTVKRMGYSKDIRPLPSVLLGAVPMTVMDVGQMYLSIASGGFKTPIKGIRSVLSAEDQPLARYPLAIDQVVESEFNAVITYALQDVVRNGTARSVLNGFRYDYGLAGKTGTTDEYRDSWFAGFSGNYLMVVWVGRDDNKSTGLTGASGAARVWSKVMQQIPQQRLELPLNRDVIPISVEYSLDPAQQDCSLTRQLPVVKDSLPLEGLPCEAKIKYDFEDDESYHFEPRNDNQQKKSIWERIFG